MRVGYLNAADAERVAATEGGLNVWRRGGVADDDSGCSGCEAPQTSAVSARSDCLESALADIRAAQCAANMAGGVTRSAAELQRHGEHGKGGGCATRRAMLLARQKSNSTSTLFTRSTVSAHDVDAILNSVAVLLESMAVLTPEDGPGDPFHALVAAATAVRVAAPASSGAPSWWRGLGSWGSTLFTATAEEETAATEMVVSDCSDCSVDSIFHFLKRSFRYGGWSPEANVIAMVLLTRLLDNTAVTFHARTWRQLLLSSLLLAQKMWDDTPLNNSGFSELWRQIYPSTVIDLQLVNQMELLFLDLLNYDLHIDCATYHGFYFELHALANEGKQLALRPLSARQARSLEAHSRDFGDAFSRRAAAAQKRAQLKHRLGEHTVALCERNWERRAAAKDELCGRLVLS